MSSARASRPDAASQPSNAEWQRDVSISYDRIGDALKAAGRREEALGSYWKSLAIREKLAASDPGNAEWRDDLHISSGCDITNRGWMIVHCIGSLKKVIGIMVDRSN